MTARMMRAGQTDYASAARSLGCLSLRQELEIGNRDLVAALDEKSELALGEIAAGLRKSIEHFPLVAHARLLHQAVRRHLDLNGECLLISEIVRRLDPLEPLALFDHPGPEILPIDLVEQVVLGVEILEAPADLPRAECAAAFEQLHGEGEDTLGRQLVRHESATLVDPIVAVPRPALRTPDPRHPAGHHGRRGGRPLPSQGEIQVPVFAGGQLDARCGFGESRCACRKYVVPRGQLDWVSASFVRLRFVTAAVSNGDRGGVARQPDGAAGSRQRYVRARQDYGLAGMDGSLHALRPVLFAPQFDGVVARVNATQAE